MAARHRLRGLLSAHAHVCAPLVRIRGRRPQLPMSMLHVCFGSVGARLPADSIGPEAWRLHTSKPTISIVRSCTAEMRRTASGQMKQTTVPAPERAATTASQECRRHHMLESRNAQNPHHTAVADSCCKSEREMMRGRGRVLTWRKRDTGSREYSRVTARHQTSGLDGYTVLNDFWYRPPGLTIGLRGGGSRGCN